MKSEEYSSFFIFHFSFFIFHLMMNIYTIIIIVTIVFSFVLDLISNIFNLKALNPKLPEEFSDVFDAEKYLNSEFTLRLPEHIREQIRLHGIRNSHLISIAPTGTISLAFADNCSNGIEPAFSCDATSRGRKPTLPQIVA